jgi:hypothetical protein
MTDITKVKNLKKLKHKRMNIFEFLASKIVNSHVCQICGRKEIWSVSGWEQIDHPKFKDKNGCSVVCIECAKQNKEIFGDWGWGY